MLFKQTVLQRQLGDNLLEGICQRTRPVLVLHERKTRVTLAARLTGKSAHLTASIIMAILRRLDPRLRQSITPDRVRGRLFDNDTAFELPAGNWPARQALQSVPPVFNEMKIGDVKTQKLQSRGQSA